MNKIILTTLCAIALSACNSSAKTEEKTAEKTAKINIKLADLATPKDVVCGMDLTDESIDDTTSYEGKIYGFCNVGCKDEFLKNPTSYLTQK